MRHARALLALWAALPRVLLCLLVGGFDGMGIGFIHLNSVRATLVPFTNGTNEDPQLMASPQVDPAQFASRPYIVRSMVTIWNRYGAWLLSRAVQIGCTPSALAAVLKVESSGSGFASDGRMIVRFENHVFDRELGNQVTFAQFFRYSSPSWTGHEWRSSPSGAWASVHSSQASEWSVITFAQSLDETAALRSASYGIAQIMGFNFASLGPYAKVQDMFMHFSASMEAQLDGLLSFIQGAVHVPLGPAGGRLCEVCEVLQWRRQSRELRSLHPASQGSDGRGAACRRCRCGL